MRWQQVVPITVVVAMIALLAYGLTRDPRELPSVLLGQPIPEFEMPTLASEPPVLTDEALQGQVTMINTWASWCVPCRMEHPQITAITLRTGVPVVGLNYKDTRKAARQWLDRFGNPFAVVVFDKKGQLGFDLGVAAVPETFIVDSNGIIRHKVVGPITPKIMNQTVIPLLKRLKREAL